MARTAKRYLGKTGESTPLTKSYKTAIYARLSVDRDCKKSESIENQLEIIKGYIQEHPELKNYKEYIDKGYTGTSFDRPGFNELMDDIKDGRINAIIVKDLSRFGRNDLETSNLLETILPFMQVRFISVNDRYDSSEGVSSNKALELALKNLVNDMYAKDISRKVYSAKRRNMNDGRYIAKEAPYGYKIDRESVNRSLVIDEEAAEVVREIYRRAGEGYCYRSIVSFLNMEGYSIPGEYKKTGSIIDRSDKRKGWRIGTLSNILSNPVYTGTLIQGKRTSKLFEGEIVHKTDAADWVVMENAHEPIISKEEYERVRNIIEAKLKKSTFLSDRGSNLMIKPNKYKKILFCGKCGSPLQMASEIRTRNGIEYRNYYFFCARGDEKSKNRACGVRITEKTLDRILYDNLVDIASGIINNSADKRKNITDFVTATEDILRKGEAEYKRAYCSLKQKIQGEKLDMSVIYGKYVDGLLSREEFISEQSRREITIRDMEANLNDMESNYEESKRQVESVIRWCLSLIRGKKRKKVDLSAELLDELVKEVRVFPEHVIEVDIPIRKPESNFLKGGDEV